MAKEFKLQDPGEGVHEAEILEIKVSEGDTVEDGDTLLTVQTDKAAVDIPAPFSGTIESIRISEGDVAKVGDVLITYTEEGEASQEKPTEPQEKAEKEQKAEKADKKKEAEEAEKADKKQKTEKEEDKKKAEKEEADTAETAEAKKPKQRPVPASPATRRLARELDVELRSVEASGPEGRVTAEDVQRAAEGEEKPEQEKPKKVEAEAEGEREERPKKERRPAREAVALPDFGRWGEIERVPLRAIRRATARQMALAWSEIPHVMHHDMADITELEQFRREHAQRIEEEGGKLTLTVLAMKAMAAALREFPRFSASLDPDSDELIMKQYCHIGVAVDTGQGLLVPVVRDVDRKSIMELAVELTELTERARNGEASQKDLQGGCITITNPGPIGGTVFTPIINYPEVAILGLGQTRLEPVVQGDLESYEVVARLRLPLCLAFDHRVIDGAEAARFVRAVMDTLGDPESFLLRV